MELGLFTFDVFQELPWPVKAASRSEIVFDLSHQHIFLHLKSQPHFYQPDTEAKVKDHPQPHLGQTRSKVTPVLGMSSVKIHMYVQCVSSGVWSRICF